MLYSVNAMYSPARTVFLPHMKFGKTSAIVSVIASPWRYDAAGALPAMTSG
jgi:hypothetical protein